MYLKLEPCLAMPGDTPAPIRRHGTARDIGVRCGHGDTILSVAYTLGLATTRLGMSFFRR